MNTETFFWCGGYTETMGGTGDGIGLLRVGLDGQPEFERLVAEVSSPSFLLQRGGMLYAADEAGGRVLAYRIWPGHSLELVGEAATSGPLPCHLSVSDGLLFAANYGDGSIDVFLLDEQGVPQPRHQTLTSEGSGPLETQQGPHAHSTLPLAGGSLLSADLGIDRVYTHRIEHGALTRTGAIELPAGTGPRDLLLHRGRTLLLGEYGSRIHQLESGEWGGGSSIASGEIVADPLAGDPAAALGTSADGRYLYVGLRASSRIAVIDAETLTGVATVPCGGEWPRHLVVHGQMMLVANQLSSTVAAYTIDQNTGIPSPVGTPAAVPSPTFLLAVA